MIKSVVNAKRATSTVRSALRDLPEKLPSNLPYVSLAEASSWIAFGHALDHGSLFEGVQSDGDGRSDAETELSDAVNTLTQYASGSLITMRGKLLDSREASAALALTNAIDPARLADFRRYDLLYDALWYGSGFMPSDAALERAFPDGRGDYYAEVTVERAALLKYFPSKVGDPAAIGSFAHIGEKLSRELTPIRAADHPALMSMTDFRARLATILKLPNPGYEELTASEVESLGDFDTVLNVAVREPLMHRQVDAFVHHPDGRLFRVPASYWGSNHDYRPVGGEGFYTDGQHGDLAHACNGQGVFVGEAETYLLQLVASGQDNQAPDPGERKFTVDEIKAWIISNPHLTNEKSARKAFMTQSRADGLSNSFAAVWKEHHGNRGRGRPRKNK